MGLIVFIGVSIVLCYLFGFIAYGAEEVNKKQEEADRKALAEYEHQTQVDEKTKAFLNSDFCKKLEPIFTDAITGIKAGCLENGGPMCNRIMIKTERIEVGKFYYDYDGSNYRSEKVLFIFEDQGYQKLSDIEQEAVAQGMTKILQTTIPGITTDRNSICLPEELYLPSLDEYNRRKEAEYQAKHKKAF